MIHEAVEFRNNCALNFSGDQKFIRGAGTIEFFLSSLQSIYLGHDLLSRCDQVINATDIVSKQAKLRVFHGAPSAPAVDVYVTAPGTSIADQSPVLSKVPFSAISDYLTIPAGSYDVKVTIAGTKTVAIKADALQVADGLTAMVAALDAKGGGSPFALQVLDER